MAKMTLTWVRDIDGYHIEKSEPARGAVGKTILGQARTTEIVRNGGDLFEFDCLKIDGLYNRVAAVTKQADAVEFAARYGLPAGRDRAELSDVLTIGRLARSLIAARDRKDWPALAAWLSEHPDLIRIAPAATSSSPFEFFFRPRTLGDAIFLQFFEDVAGGANLKLCARHGCGEWFKYGPGTNRRETAHYCSPRCQKASAYAQLKAERKGP